MSQSSRRSETTNSHSLVTVLGLAIAFLIVLAIVTGRVERVVRAALPLLILLGLIGLVVGILKLGWRYTMPGRLLGTLASLRSQGRNAKLAQGRVWLLGLSYRAGVWRFRLRLPRDFTLADLKAKRDAVEEGVGASAYFERDPGQRRLVIVTLISRQPPRELSYEACYRKFAEPASPGLWNCLGENLRHAPRWWNWREGHTLLVGGLKGTGKSSTQRAVICRSAEQNHPDALQFLLIDPAGGREMNTFDGLPHLWSGVGGQVVKGRGSSVAALKPLEAAVVALGREREEREQLLEDSGAKTWAEFCRQRPGDARPELLVIVEEIRLLSPQTTADKAVAASRKTIMAHLTDGAMLGRAVGIYTMGLTQRPDARALPTDFKSQLDATLGFRVRSGTDSRVLFEEDNSLAADLPVEIPGRAIFQWGTVQEEVQTPWLSPEEASARVEAIRERYASWSPRQQPRVVLEPAQTTTPQPVFDATEDDIEAARRLDIDQLSKDQVWLLLGELDPRDTGIGPDGIFDPWRDRKRYYLSRKWKLICRLVRLRSGGRCELQREGCLGMADQVHHENYDHLGFEESDLSELKDACDACHRLVSGKGKVPVETNGRTGRRG